MEAVKGKVKKKKAELEKASETERDQYWGFNYLYGKLQLKLREHWQWTLLSELVDNHTSDKARQGHAVFTIQITANDWADPTQHPIFLLIHYHVLIPEKTPRPPFQPLWNKDEFLGCIFYSKEN